MNDRGVICGNCKIGRHGVCAETVVVEGVTGPCLCVCSTTQARMVQRIAAIRYCRYCYLGITEVHDCSAMKEIRELKLRIIELQAQLTAVEVEKEIGGV